MYANAGDAALSGGQYFATHTEPEKWPGADNDSLCRENVRLYAKLWKHDLFCEFREIGRRHANGIPELEINPI